jgi:hypothetical protein
MPANDVTIKAHFQPLEAINAQTLNTTLAAYPNPTTGIFQLRITNLALRNENIQIFDISGRLVQMSTMSNLSNPSNKTIETTINLSHLPNGIYYLHIGKEIIKIAKVR